MEKEKEVHEVVPEEILKPLEKPKPKKVEEVAEPWIESETEIFKKFWHWMWQANTTMWLIIVTTIISVAAWQFIPWSNEAAWRFLQASRENLVSGNFISLVSPMFLHADEGHLVGNMIALLIFGRIMERKFGNWKMLALYFGAGIFSSIFAASLGETFIGASGAIAGLIALALLLYPFQITHIMMGLPLPILFVGWVMILNDIFGLLFPRPEDYVAHLAHLGGNLSVFVILFFLLRKEYPKIVKKALLINFGFAGVLVALIFAGIPKMMMTLSLTVPILIYVLYKMKKEKVEELPL